ncbi:YraN family protein [Ostreibacterium oceani]|uniref:UPF0102 protein GCU85_04250 n=1 Tax=Ostreibacterium oceani TaxID=2654998 RepID=A0A6N7EXU3_9GAMM|nr:YraN family protein [Ostreibacterium oceani]MPV85947.1 YraN family protein [Ostreibacterium oceani]
MTANHRPAAATESSCTENSRAENRRTESRHAENNRSRETGFHCEKIAKQFLKKQGLKGVCENYHSRFGEIDLIMQDGNTLVFVEVKSRQINAQVSAVESISAQKIQKIIKTAEHYLLQLSEIPDCRFDVIAVTHNHQLSDYTIEWIKAAF